MEKDSTAWGVGPRLRSPGIWAAGPSATCTAILLAATRGWAPSLVDDQEAAQAEIITDARPDPGTAIPAHMVRQAEQAENPMQPRQAPAKLGTVTSPGGKGTPPPSPPPTPPVLDPTALDDSFLDDLSSDDTFLCDLAESFTSSPNSSSASLALRSITSPQTTLPSGCEGWEEATLLHQQPAKRACMRAEDGSTTHGALPEADVHFFHSIVEGMSPEAMERVSWKAVNLLGSVEAVRQRISASAPDPQDVWYSASTAIMKKNKTWWTPDIWPLKDRIVRQFSVGEPKGEGASRSEGRVRFLYREEAVRHYYQRHGALRLPLCAVDEAIFPPGVQLAPDLCPAAPFRVAEPCTGIFADYFRDAKTAAKCAAFCQRHLLQSLLASGIEGFWAVAAAIGARTTPAPSMRPPCTLSSSPSPSLLELPEACLGRVGELPAGGRSIYQEDNHPADRGYASLSPILEELLKCTESLAPPPPAWHPGLPPPPLSLSPILGPHLHSPHSHTAPASLMRIAAPPHGPAASGLSRSPYSQATRVEHHPGGSEESSTSGNMAVHVTSNLKVAAESRHKNSIRNGVAAQPVTCPDYSMAESNGEEIGASEMLGWSACMPEAPLTSANYSRPSFFRLMPGPNPVSGEAWRGLAKPDEVWQGLAKFGEVWQSWVRFGEVWGCLSRFRLRSSRPPGEPRQSFSQSRKTLLWPSPLGRLASTLGGARLGQGTEDPRTFLCRSASNLPGGVQPQRAREAPRHRGPLMGRVVGWPGFLFDSTLGYPGEGHPGERGNGHTNLLTDEIGRDVHAQPPPQPPRSPHGTLAAALGCDEPPLPDRMLTSCAVLPAPSTGLQPIDVDVMSALSLADVALLLSTHVNRSIYEGEARREHPTFSASRAVLIQALRRLQLAVDTLHQAARRASECPSSREDALGSLLTGAEDWGAELKPGGELHLAAWLIGPGATHVVLRGLYTIYQCAAVALLGHPRPIPRTWPSWSTPEDLAQDMIASATDVIRLPLISPPSSLRHALDWWSLRPFRWVGGSPDRSSVDPVLNPTLEVVVSGPIGVGKSSAISTAALSTGWPTALERVDVWERTGALDLLYNGDASKHGELVTIVEMLIASTAFAERSHALRMLETTGACDWERIGRMGRPITLSERDFRCMLEVFRAGTALPAYGDIRNAAIGCLIACLPRHQQVHVHMVAPPDLLMQRTRGRGRSSEAAIGPQQHAQLLKAYDDVHARASINEDIFILDASGSPQYAAQAILSLTEWLGGVSGADAPIVEGRDACGRHVVVGFGAHRAPPPPPPPPSPIVHLAANSRVAADSRHPTSVHLGTAAQSVACPDYPMAESSGDEMEVSEVITSEPTNLEGGRGGRGSRGRSGRGGRGNRGGRGGRGGLISGGGASGTGGPGEQTSPPLGSAHHPIDVDLLHGPGGLLSIPANPQGPDVPRRTLTALRTFLTSLMLLAGEVADTRYALPEILKQMGIRSRISSQLRRAARATVRITTVPNDGVGLENQIAAVDAFMWAQFNAAETFEDDLLTVWSRVRRCAIKLGRHVYDMVSATTEAEGEGIARAELVALHNGRGPRIICWMMEALNGAECIQGEATACLRPWGGPNPPHDPRQLPLSRRRKLTHDIFVHLESLQPALVEEVDKHLHGPKLWFDVGTIWNSLDAEKERREDLPPASPYDRQLSRILFKDRAASPSPLERSHHEIIEAVHELEGKDIFFIRLGGESHDSHTATLVMSMSLLEGTVADLKREVERRCEWPAHQQSLTYRGKLLMDQRYLPFYCLQRNSTISLTGRGPGGALITELMTDVADAEGRDPHRPSCLSLSRLWWGLYGGAYDRLQQVVIPTVLSRPDLLILSLLDAEGIVKRYQDLLHPGLDKMAPAQAERLTDHWAELVFEGCALPSMLRRLGHRLLPIVAAWDAELGTSNAYESAETRGGALVGRAFHLEPWMEDTDRRALIANLSEDELCFAFSYAYMLHADACAAHRMLQVLVFAVRSRRERGVTNLLRPGWSDPAHGSEVLQMLTSPAGAYAAEHLPHAFAPSISDDSVGSSSMHATSVRLGNANQSVSRPHFSMSHGADGGYNPLDTTAEYWIEHAVEALLIDPDCHDASTRRAISEVVGLFEKRPTYSSIRAVHAALLQRLFSARRWSNERAAAHCSTTCARLDRWAEVLRTVSPRWAPPSQQYDDAQPGPVVDVPQPSSPSHPQPPEPHHMPPPGSSASRPAMEQRTPLGYHPALASLLHLVRLELGGERSPAPLTFAQAARWCLLKQAKRARWLVDGHQHGPMAYVTPDAMVQATSMHSTSHRQGNRAQAVACADFSMADLAALYECDNASASLGRPVCPAWQECRPLTRHNWHSVHSDPQGGICLLCRARLHVDFLRMYAQNHHAPHVDCPVCTYESIVPYSSVGGFSSSLGLSINQTLRRWRRAAARQLLDDMTLHVTMGVDLRPQKQRPHEASHGHLTPPAINARWADDEESERWWEDLPALPWDQPRHKRARTGSKSHRAALTSDPPHAAPPTPNSTVRARSNHPTSTLLGNAAQSVARADFSMADTVLTPHSDTPSSPRGLDGLYWERASDQPAPRVFVRLQGTSTKPSTPRAAGARHSRGSSPMLGRRAQQHEPRQHTGRSRQRPQANHPAPSIARRPPHTHRTRPRPMQPPHTEPVHAPGTHPPTDPAPPLDVAPRLYHLGDAFSTLQTPTSLARVADALDGLALIHGVAAPTERDRAAIRLVTTRLLTAERLQAFDFPDVSDFQHWNAHIVGTPVVQASMALMSISAPHLRRRYSYIASTPSMHATALQHGPAASGIFRSPYSQAARDENPPGEPAVSSTLGYTVESLRRFYDAQQQLIQAPDCGLDELDAVDRAQKAEAGEICARNLVSRDAELLAEYERHALLAEDLQHSGLFHDEVERLVRSPRDYERLRDAARVALQSVLDQVDLRAMDEDVSQAARSTYDQASTGAASFEGTTQPRSPTAPTRTTHPQAEPNIPSASLDRRRDVSSVLPVGHVHLPLLASLGDLSLINAVAPPRARVLAAASLECRGRSMTQGLGGGVIMCVKCDDDRPGQHWAPLSAITALLRGENAHARAKDLRLATTLGLAISFRAWQAEQWRAWHLYEWPLRDTHALERLLSDKSVSPTCLCGCEFTGSMRIALSLARCAFVLSADIRECELEGMHYCGSLQDILELNYKWKVACFWPPCTQQTRSDTTSQAYKLRDGRAFWGIAFYIYVLSHTAAEVIMVEQPDTIIHEYYEPQEAGALRQRVRPSFFGDTAGKPVNLTWRGGDVAPTTSTATGAGDPVSYFDFKDSEERDRWRSSWARHPCMVAALAAHLASPRGQAAPMDFRTEILRFAQAWGNAGWPVPAGFLQSSGRPPSPTDRAYQFTRGPGDGRVIAEAALEDFADGGGPSATHRLAYWLRSHHSKTICVAGLAATTVVVTFVSTWGRPLIHAHVDGLHLVGMELACPAHAEGALAVAQRLTALATGSESLLCLMAGSFAGGQRLAVSPIPQEPTEPPVVATPARRNALAKAGHGFLWHTLDALVGTQVYELAARSIAAVEAFSRPLTKMADDPSFGAADGRGQFAFGATDTHTLATPRVGRQLPAAPSTLAKAISAGRMLSQTLLALSGTDCAYYHQWAERILPPPIQEIPEAMLERLPSFSAKELSFIPMPKIAQPLERAWAPRRPRQPSRTSRCPRSPLDLFTSWGQLIWRQRTSRWLKAALLDLECIEELGEKCTRRRPKAMAVGVAGMHAWSRGIVWDFTFERHPTCGVPLDFHAQTESNLNRTYWSQRLHDYPDQKLLSFIVEGVQLDAHVELHSVWIPHLVSLPRGYSSVKKEILELERLGWYRFFGDLPFWPLYLNAQGSVARKLEPDRFRRTTDGGGPRLPVTDETGLPAISINEASKVYHVPRHHSPPQDPEAHAWATYHRLLDSSVRPPLVRGTKWPPEEKPSLATFMQYVTVLRRASEVLGEPLYIFSDDFRTWFSQLSLSAAEWNLFNVAFYSADGLDSIRGSPHLRTQKGGMLYFVSERRLGFGCHPSSKIAQSFSDAILHVFREDMDRLDLDVDPHDPRPAMQRWRQERQRVADKEGTNLTLETRLWGAVIFTDDPIICVVGVERAVRALRVWRAITRQGGLITAIPEKRVLGVWARWLGTIFFTTLGLVIVPRERLLRAASAIRLALSGHMMFGDYRSLVGLLEHLRSVRGDKSNVMYGLYEPFIGEHEDGPARLVTATPLMTAQLNRWLHSVMRVGGAPVTICVHPVSLAKRAGDPTFALSADAATDCAHPGLGGFCHGMWWYLEATPLMLRTLHITALELLATGVNAIVFEPYLRECRRITLLSDALATPFILSRHRARSSALSAIHRDLLSSHAFQRVAERAEIAHFAGISNVAADACSRWNMPVLRQLCVQIGVTPTRVEIPPEALRIVYDAVQRAVLNGWSVEPSRHKRTRPPGPRELLDLNSPTVPRRRLLTFEEQALEVGQSNNEEKNAVKRLAELGTIAGDPLRANSAMVGRVHHSLPPNTTPCTTAPRSAPAVSRRVDTPPRVHLGVQRAGALRFATASGEHTLHRPRRQALHSAGERQMAIVARGLRRSPLLSEEAADKLGQMMVHSQSLSAAGTAEGTLRKDEAAWQMWTRYARQLGFDPHLDAKAAGERPDVVTLMLAGFLLHVYPTMSGKAGRRWAKPRSAFAHIHAVIRCFKRWSVPMPKATTVEHQLRGLLRGYENHYGKLVLAPQRKAPIRYSMIERLHDISDGQRLGPYRFTLDQRLTANVLLAADLCWDTASRLGDLINPQGWAVRADVSCVLHGKVLQDPAPSQWQELLDICSQPCKADTRLHHLLLGPNRTKTDQFGEIHCPFPSVLPLSDAPVCAARSLVQQELQYPCRGSDRSSTPLICGEHHRPPAHSTMARFLYEAWRHLYDDAVARAHSWHSFRIGKACALHAAGCPDAEIQLLCRWVSPDSLRLYRRLGSAAQAKWTERVRRVQVDATQTGTIPIVCNSEGFAALQQECTRRVDAAAATLVPSLHTAEPGRTPAPDSSPLTRSNAVGRHILVPRHTWPDYSCSENGGAGWSGVIVNLKGGAATVAFIQATTPRGLPYEDVVLDLGVLSPL